MSDFFRIPKLPLESLSIRELAHMCHRAENTDDDILLMNVQAELERREKECGVVGKFYSIEGEFMVEYRAVWPEYARKK